MADALEFRGVSAGYGETVVLEDINLALAPGENVSIIGRNGVGKTTLLATVMGHTRLHKGDVLLGGTEHRAHADLCARARRPRLCAAGARDLSRRCRCARTSRSARGRATGRRRACSSCSRACRSGSPTWATSSPAASSRCCRSRARCSPIPTVLLMDEPTEGLAPVLVETLTAVLLKLRDSGLSIVLVEQNSRVALGFSERAVVMDKGRIVYDGASAALRDDPEKLAGLVGIVEATPAR